MKGKNKINVNSKKGSVSVLLLCFFSALTFLFLFLYENAAEKALKSALQSNLMLSEHAVLSYYIPELQTKYGLYAMSNDEELLKERLEFFITGTSPLKQSLEENNALLHAKKKKVEVDTSAFGFLISESIEMQMKRAILPHLTVQGVEQIPGTKQLLKNLRNIMNATKLKGGSDETDGQEKEIESEVENQEEKALEDMKNKTEEELKKMESDSNIKLEDPKKIALLPSVMMNQTRGKSELPNFEKIQENIFLDNISDSILTNEYVLYYLGNYCKKKESFYQYEVEYVIAGEYADQSNFKVVKREIFSLCTLLNLLSAYRDAQVKGAISAMGASIGLPANPAAQFIIASVLSASEATKDIRLLLAEERVPVLKTYLDWQVLGGRRSEFPGNKEKGMDYQDFLRVLLCFQGNEVKRYRAMDAIQLNLTKDFGDEFCLGDYCVGFDYKCEFKNENKIVKGKEISFERICKY